MTVVCHVKRQSPPAEPRWTRYEVEVPSGATVLDLLRLLAGQDPGLAHNPHHCKQGVCASCVLLIDGRKRLACRTLVQPGEIRLEPAPGLPLIKDLLVDLLPLHGIGLDKPRRHEEHQGSRRFED